MDIGNAAHDGAPSVPGLAGLGLELGYHGEPVVRGASIRIRTGEVTALVGPNGSGKSTLLRTLARLNRPMGGEVHLDGDTPALALTAQEFARRVTMLPQSRPTPGGVTVADVVAYGRHPHRGRWRAADPDGPRAVARAMTVTGTTDLADQPVNELSGGQRQRVWLATCLAQETGVLLLDEPTTFLDLRYQVEILDLMRDLAVEHATAVGVVLHDLDQAAEVADRVVLLHEGRVMADGPPVDVLTARHLTDAYGIPVEVTTDPATGRVSTRPVGRHTRRPAPPVPAH